MDKDGHASVVVVRGVGRALREMGQDLTHQELPADMLRALDKLSNKLDRPS
jgi:hypothetical protein